MRFLLPLFAVVAAAQPSPESLGFSSQRLRALHAELDGVVARKELTGIVTLIGRHGKVVDSHVAGADFKKDSIFRIYSMTKPIVGVAMMMLYEEGKWSPDDPIAKYLPELKGLKVMQGDQLVDPAHPPTMHELLTHTAGFTYGMFGATPVDMAYRKANPLAAPSNEAMVTELAKLPLAYQPGAKWVYSVGVDVQGAIIEKLSGKKLDVFLRERIFQPLQMTDTAYFVAPEKRARLARVYRYNDKRELVSAVQPNELAEMPSRVPGGHGLVSTAQDYARFAMMLANHGELDGARLLAPATVALMRANHLPDSLLDGTHGIGKFRARPGLGFGYDVASYYDPAKARTNIGRGSFFWDGLAGTWMWIDPQNHVVFVGMIQHMGGGLPVDLQHLSRVMTMAALVDPKK